jgi:hypothetical protein
MQKLTGVFDPLKPVFTFASGAYLTPSRFSSVLSTLSQDVCSPGVLTISCNSFRAGIPSLLSLFPDVASIDIIKGTVA